MRLIDMASHVQDKVVAFLSLLLLAFLLPVHLKGPSPAPTATDVLQRKQQNLTLSLRPPTILMVNRTTIQAMLSPEPCKIPFLFCRQEVALGTTWTFLILLLMMSQMAQHSSTSAQIRLKGWTFPTTTCATTIELLQA